MKLTKKVIHRSFWYVASAYLAIVALTGLSLLATATADATTSAKAVAVAHTDTPNPTCVTTYSPGGYPLKGCAQASPMGITFTWTGYVSAAFYEAPLQLLNLNGPGVTITNQEVCGDIPVGISTCQYFLALSQGQYNGNITVENAAINPPLATFFLDVDSSDPPAPQLPVDPPVVGMASTPDGSGYWLVGSDGSVQGFGDAQFYGSMAGNSLNAPIVGISPTADGKGYWLLGKDGGVFSFGDAQFYGSTGAIHLNQPVVGMTATPSGHGYYLDASDGGIFAFGDARFQGSMGGTKLNKPAVGMAIDPSTGGYWIVASDGGIFAFNAPFFGSTGAIHLNQPIVGMASSSQGSGYRFVASDGGIFDFGNAPFFGSGA